MALTKVTSGLISADASSVDLNIDDGTLYIDSTNNRVGIGTTSPNAALDILGTTSDQLRLRTAETEEYKIGRNASTGFLEFDGTQTGYIGYVFKNGNVGIGTSSPAQTVEVSASATSAIQITSTSGSAQLMLNPFDTNPAYINYNRSSASVLSFYDHNASSERMRIDSSGRVGIGTSSPSATLTVNTGSDGTNVYIDNNGTQLAIGSTSSVNYINTQNGNAALAIQTNGNERLRIDSSGNLLFSNADTVIGSNTSDGSDNQALYLCGGGNQTAGRGANLRLHGNEDSPAGDAVLFSGSAAGSDILLSAYSSTSTIQFATNGGLERMRIDSSGLVLIGTTSAAISAGLEVRKNTGNIAYFYRDDGTGVYLAAGNTSWSTASDERLKTTITPFQDSLTKICSLQAGTGRYLTDSEDVSRSFLIAQDVQAVLPEAVDIADDEIGTMSLRYMDLIPLLVSSIKELKEKNDTLEARITALENT